MYVCIYIYIYIRRERERERERNINLIKHDFCGRLRRARGELDEGVLMS